MRPLNQEDLEVKLRKIFNKYSTQEISQAIDELPAECFIVIDNSFISNDFDKLLLELIRLYEKRDS